MCAVPDKLRLGYLKLDGFRFGTVLHVCPRCDYQQAYDPARSSTACPVCDASLAAMMVMPITAKAAA